METATSDPYYSSLRAILDAPIPGVAYTQLRRHELRPIKTYRPLPNSTNTAP